MDVLGEDGEVRAGREQILEVAAVVFGQFGGPGHEPGHQPPRRRTGSLGLGAALVEVAHEQVRAAGVAQLADLGEQPGDRRSGFGGQSTAQVVAVGVGPGSGQPLANFALTSPATAPPLRLSGPIARRPPWAPWAPWSVFSLVSPLRQGW